MKLSIVVAMANDGAIGRANRLPWPRLPADMLRFRRLTMGKSLIVGRRTWDSLPFKPPDGRQSVIVTRDEEAGYERIRALDRGSRHLVEVAKSIPAAVVLSSAWNVWKDQGEIMVIGGAEVYREALPVIGRIYLTLINATFPDADTHFPGGVPDWSPPGPWRMVEHERREPDAANPLAMEFVTLERRG